MIQIGFCHQCFDPIYEKDKGLYFLHIFFCENYVINDLRPFSISIWDKKAIQLESLGYLVSHETDEDMLIKPLGHEKESEKMHWFCLKNHLQDDEKENEDDINN